MAVNENLQRKINKLYNKININDASIEIFKHQLDNSEYEVSLYCYDESLCAESYKEIDRLESEIEKLKESNEKLNAQIKNMDS